MSDKLDAMQAIKEAYDPATGRLKVDSSAELEISHTADSIKIGDGTDFLAINADGSINVNATSVGGATEAKQDVGNTSLSSIDDKLADKVGDIQPAGMHGFIGSGAGTFDSYPSTVEPMGADGFGNEQTALWVYDKSPGRSSRTTSETFAVGSPADMVVNSAGGSTTFIDVSGTWTGTIHVEGVVGSGLATLPLRELGSGTVVTSITANGSYVIEGRPGDLFVINGVASGSADIYTFDSAYNQTGTYSHQAGDWNVGVKDGANSLTVNSDGSTNQRVVSQLVTVPHDAITVEQTSSTVETYKYRTGGAAGSIVATVTVTYTDATKETLSSVVRT